MISQTSLSLPTVKKLWPAQLFALTGLIEKATTKGKWFSLVVIGNACLLIALFGLIDCRVKDVDVEIFFLIPIYFVTRVLGRYAGLFIAAICAVVAVGADVHRGDDLHSIVLYWNGAALLAVFGLVVLLLDALQQLQIMLEAKVDQRTLELEQANVELKSVQFRLVEAARMESVGRIAAGIAHEVKNPLMTITMAADYLAQVMPADDADASIMIEDMRVAIDRANRVISELLEFSRPAELSLELEDFHAIAEHALGLMKLELRRKHINVVRNFSEDSSILRLDKNKIEQVLVNLFMNAIQAMPDSGTLTIATHPPKTGAGFTVDIEDDGPGISTENLVKIEQPFFTTKSAGQGTGLGLAVSRNIVKMHGGILTLGNRSEGGARARLEFPTNTAIP
jgi:signal transduction histidine kinase